MDEMSDLEITKLCAEAMGFSWSEPMPIDHQVFVWVSVGVGNSAHGERYAPLHSDAAAMGLAKRFKLFMNHSDADESPYWKVGPHGQGVTNCDESLNRAICITVANMQKAKHEA